MEFFSRGENIGLNACVGKNGWPETGYYAGGFERAVHTMCRDVISKGFDPDEVVYPIVFCARHRIELFLKMQIRLIERIKGQVTVSDPKLMRTHDLAALWDMYAEATNLCDPRYAGVVRLIEPAVREFSMVDPTGETFRYAYDNSNKKHLENSVSLINIEVFYSAFCRLSNGIKDAEGLTELLSHEYRTGTYTRFASRAVIERISKELPKKSEWSAPAFREIKNDISKRYGVSLRGLSEIIDVIKYHREFAANIGDEIPLKDISAEKISRFLELRIRATADSSGLGWRDAMLSGAGLDSDLYLLLRAEYSIREISALLALADVGGRHCYSEEYDGLREQYENGEDDVSELAIYLDGKSFIAPKIIGGLKKLKQKSAIDFIARAGIDVSEVP